MAFQQLYNQLAAFPSAKGCSVPYPPPIGTRLVRPSELKPNVIVLGFAVEIDTHRLMPQGVKAKLELVAIRLSIAEHANCVQNLVHVFARLSPTIPGENLDFPAQVQADSTNGGSQLCGNEQV